MVGGEAELRWAVREGAFGRDVREFLDQLIQSEVLELDLRKQIVPKPRKPVEGDGCQLQEVLDGFIAARTEMSNLQAMLGRFDQSLDTLAVVVAGEISWASAWEGRTLV
jgi:hypothetical protein